MVLNSCILCGSNYMCNTFEQVNKAEWILCPICSNKTRTVIREDTELRNFPLYCPKCKNETIINAQDMKVMLAEHK